MSSLPNMPSSLRNRSACDRCHSQKLRCPKQQGSLVCTRCVKSGARCVYSPPGTTSTQWNAPEAALDVGPCASASATAAFDWMLGAPDNFDFNSFLSPASPGVNVNLSAQPPSPCRLPSSPRTSSLQSLSKILLDADDLLMRLPLQTTLHVSQAEPQVRLLGSLRDTMATNTVLERFFGLAQQLIDLYPTALDASLSGNSRPTSSCDLSNCTHALEMPASLSNLEDQVEAYTRSTAPDVALTNLLVSCHMRLLDVLDRFFLMAAACTRVTLASRREPEFDLSEMRVGSFVPEKKAAALMQIALLGHLVAGLADRTLLVGRTISAFATEGDQDIDEVLVLRSQHNLLTNRQKTKGEQVRNVEDFLKHFDFPSK